MIRSLEQETGFPMLIRTQYGVRLTADGKAMLPALHNIVKAQQIAAEQGAAIRGVIQGSLNIGSYYSVSAAWLPKVLRVYRQKYPQVKIHLREGTNLDLSAWLNEGSIDCSLAARPTKGTVYDWIPLARDELFVWLPPTHAAASRSDFPIPELDHAPFIITLPEHDTDIDRFLQNHQIQPDIQFTTADPYTTYCMVEEGLGLSLNNDLTTKNWTGRVVTRPFRPRQYIELGIAVPHMKDASPVPRKFIACAVQLLSAEEQPDNDASCMRGK